MITEVLCRNDGYLLCVCLTKCLAYFILQWYIRRHDCEVVPVLSLCVNHMHQAFRADAHGFLL